MTREEHREAFQTWIGAKSVSHGKATDLSEALYAISELGLWPDNVDSVSTEQAMVCWQLIERLHNERFPENLKM